jgi:PAS domain S-box-containing protein
MTEPHFQPTYSLAALDAGRRRPWFSLRKLLILLVLMAAAPLMVVEIVSSQREQDRQVRHAHESLHALATLIASSNARAVEGIGQFLTALSESPATSAGDPETCVRYLRRVLSLQPAYVNFGLIDLNGRLVCDATGSGASVYLGDRDYFRRAMETGAPAAGSYQVGRLTGRQSLVFSRPLAAPDGAIRGVVFAAMDVRSMADSLRGASAVPGSSVQLVDRFAVVLATSDAQAEPVGARLADEVLRDAVLARRNGALPVEADGQAVRLRAVQAVQAVQVNGTHPFFVVAAVPAERIIAPALRGLEFRLAGILAMAISVAVLVWVLGQRLVVRPLGQLIAGLRHVEAEDYARALSQPRTPLRELDDLQRSLGSLVIGLEARRFERDQALGALSERETRYRELFKANPQVMVVVDVHSLHFLAVNEAASAFYGYTHEEFLDLTLLDIRRAFRRVEPIDPQAPRVWTHQLKNGTTRQVEVLVSPTVFEGLAAELVMVTDVTARLAAEARVRESSERLEQRVAERTRELELANHELEAFSYSVSHDLRNPLGAVGMFGQMLSAHLGDSVDAQAKLCLARIEQGVRGMERLVDDLMALAQVTRTELLVVSVDLSAVCRDVLKDLREGDPARQVEVVLDEGLGCLGDAGLLRRLMTNLIGNAWKFTARTPGARIHIGRQPDGPAGGPPVFFVQDNGAGFDMKFAGRLFLPFERLHGDHDFPGTGVGLATVQRIVARHGGRIWAEAEVN